MSYPGYAMGSADDLQSLADECRGMGVDCLTFAADVRDDAAVTAAVRAVVAQFGAIDILFNNAGICGYGLCMSSRTTPGIPCSTSTSRDLGLSLAGSSLS